MAKNQQFKYDLTIGMIVKNEEKYLERCLLALEPLRQQIDCELIITDTGSTDRTVEIAKNYADTFLTFEWCNDFAAARNQGLSRAKGHWFMFVDADEIADEETIDKLIQFMKSDTRDTYDNATVDIINYKDKKEIDFDLLVASRLTNLEKREQKFTGALHENLHWTDNSFAIQTKFYHYGYTDAMKPKKLVRNQEILDIMMEETPNVMHIHQANINNQTDVFKKIALCEETMKLAEEKKMDDNETHFVSMQLVRCYHFVDRFDDFEALLDKYLTNETRDILPKLEILYAAAFTYGIENSTEKKVKYYKAYLEMYQALESKPDTVYMGMCPYFSNTQEKFVETSFLLASHYLEQEDLAMVNQLLNDINFKRYEEVFDNPSRKMEYMALAMRSKSEDLILRLYEYIKQNKKEEQILAFIDSLNDIYYTIANDKKMIFHSSFSGEEDTFSAINSLREVEYDFSKCTSKTLELLDDDRLAYETLLY
ncbi:MAG: glycosyltransferase, partial [Bacillota bacterium]